VCLKCLDDGEEFDTACQRNDSGVCGDRCTERIDEPTDGVAIDRLLHTVEEQVDVVGRHRDRERVRDVGRREQNRIGVRESTRKAVGEELFADFSASMKLSGDDNAAVSAEGTAPAPVPADAIIDVRLAGERWRPRLGPPRGRHP